MPAKTIPHYEINKAKFLYFGLPTGYMVSVETNDGSALLRFQGRRGPTTNKLSAEETEELINELEKALETIQSD